MFCLCEYQLSPNCVADVFVRFILKRLGGGIAELKMWYESVHAKKLAGFSVNEQGVFGEGRFIWRSLYRR